jgi:hypothetical protein
MRLRLSSDSEPRNLTMACSGRAISRFFILHDSGAPLKPSVMPASSPSMIATQQRDAAGRLAPTDPTRALATARAIEDPWFACQALAWVARFAPENQFIIIIRESLRVCRAEVDPYRVVAPAAWPIRAIVERNRLEMLPSVIPELLLRAQDIEILASRSEALFLLFQAVFPSGRENWLAVFQSLREASTPLISWRQRRNLRDAILIVWGEDKPLAQEILNALDDVKLKKKVEKLLATSEPGVPRAFFWTTAA